MSDEAVAWTLRQIAHLRRGQQLARTRPPDAPTNCILWALAQMDRGGTMRLQPSSHGPWFHASWEAPDGAVWEYCPPSDLVAIVEATHATMPPSLFVGTVRRVR